jgi:hypothetical protein
MFICGPFMTESTKQRALLGATSPLVYLLFVFGWNRIRVTSLAYPGLEMIIGSRLPVIVATTAVVHTRGMLLRTVRKKQPAYAPASIQSRSSSIRTKNRIKAGAGKRLPGSIYPGGQSQRMVRWPSWPVSSTHRRDYWQLFA